MLPIKLEKTEGNCDSHGKEGSPQLCWGRDHFVFYFVVLSLFFQAAYYMVVMIGFVE